MKRQLPARPNLEHLRTQAKTLLTKLREGDPEAARLFSKHLPKAGQLRELRLADAQEVIARKSGFAKWPGLARHVDRLRSIEGTWAFRSLELDGNGVPAAMLGSSFLLIDGDRFRMESPEATYEGLFTIDVEAVPHRIDIDFNEGPEAGNRCEGIFDLNGDAFTICLGLVGSSRPVAFASTPGSGHALEKLVRVDRTRPARVDGGTPPLETPDPVAVPATGDFDTALTATAEKLQGEWLPLELITSGSPLQASYLPFGSRMHSGVETKVVFGGQTMVHARLRVNESANPLEIDYLNLSGKGKGSLSLGLFRWDGDEAVFCMGAAGATRPSDFTCDKGSGRIFSRWKRKS
jgi:uncharacterized protein (TIGR03067 family)